MKLLHQYEYKVRIISNNENFFGTMSVNVRSSCIYYTITYDGSSVPSLSNTIPLLKESKTDRFSIFKIIAKSTIDNYRIINL